jgi:hypothetical protein
MYTTGKSIIPGASILCQVPKGILRYLFCIAADL